MKKNHSLTLSAFRDPASSAMLSCLRRLKLSVLLVVISMTLLTTAFGPVTAKSVKIDFSKTVSMKSLVEKVEVISLESNAQTLTAPYSNVKVFNGRLYVADKGNQTLKVFDIGTGKFAGSFGNQGKAANEYYEISDFFVTGEHIIILSSSEPKMLFFDLDGKYQSTKIPESNYNKLAVIDDGYLLMTGGFGEEDEKRGSLVELGNDMKIRKYLLPNPVERLGFAWMPEISTHGKEHYCFRTFYDNIYRYRNGNVDTFYAFDFGKFSSKQEYEKSIASSGQSGAVAVRRTNASIDKFGISDKYSFTFISKPTPENVENCYFIEDLKSGKSKLAVMPWLEFVTPVLVDDTLYIYLDSMEFAELLENKQLPIEYGRKVDEEGIEYFLLKVKLKPIN